MLRSTGARRSRFSADSGGGGGGGGSPFFTHMPAGYTIIEDQPFSSFTGASGQKIPSGGKWVYDPQGFGISGALTAGSDATAPHSGPDVWSCKFPFGFVGGSAPWDIGRPFASDEQYKNLFLAFSLKYSDPWNNSNTNAGTKMWWVAGDQEYGTANYLSTAPGGSIGGAGVHDPGNMFFSINQQGGQVDPRTPGVDGNRDTPGMVGNLGNSVADFEQYIGSYIKIEVLLKANTADGNFDGEFHGWINGTKTHEYPRSVANGGAAGLNAGVNWMMDMAHTGVRKWLSLMYNPTYGGGTAIVPQDQWQFWDGMLVAGSDF